MRTILVVLVTLIVSAAILGCASDQGTESKITVGVIAPLTGDFSVYGKAIRNGMELARSDLSKEGVDVEVIYEDGCVPKETLTAARKLVDADGVDFIAGTFCIIGIPGITPFTEPLNMSVMGTAAMPAQFLSGHVTSTNIQIPREAHAEADYARKRLNASTAAIIYIDTDFGLSYSDSFAKRFQELGGRITTIERFAIGDSDYRTQLSKIAAADPDVIQVILMGPKMGVLLKQAKELDITAPLITMYEAEDQSVLDSAGSAAEGLIVSTSHWQDGNPAQEAFESKYQATYAEKPGLLSAAAYDALMLQSAAFRMCHGDRECMYSTIMATQNYHGASGSYSMDSQGAAMKDIIFKIVKDGAFVPLEE